MAPEIAAFFSYSHSDNEVDGSHLNKLRERIEKELRALSGRKVTIFYDRRDIAWGDTWKSRIDGAIATSAFLLPVISPSFLTSKECRRELELFAEHEQRQNRRDLILPIYYIPVPALETSEPTNDRLVELLRSRQYLDWRPFRYKKLHTEKARTAIGQLAGQLLTALAERQAGRAAVHDKVQIARSAREAQPTALTNRQEERAPTHDDLKAEGPYADEDMSVVVRVRGNPGDSIDVRIPAERGMALRALVSENSSLDHGNRIGRALYRLLMTSEVARFLARPVEMEIEVDNRTAGIPWELLDEGTSLQPPRVPWTVRSRLLRCFRGIEAPRARENTGKEASVLVIGDPPVDHIGYPPLPGARAEAIAIERSFSRHLESKDEMIIKILPGSEPHVSDADASTIISALLERDWRVVHVAGHGEPGGGVVLSQGAFLGPREFAALPRVPELVFLNCCHLPSVTRSETPTWLGYQYSRPISAGMIAEKLLAMGVSSVVVAGWPVDDEASMLFANGFYEALLQGQRFSEAVTAAREAALKLDRTITWGAYQCYGNPDWTLRN